MSLKHTRQFLSFIESTLSSDECIRLTLSVYKGSEPDLKKIVVRPVILKGEKKLHITYRYKTRDVVKNYSYDKALEIFGQYVGYGAFHSGVLSSTKQDYYLTILSEERSSLKKKQPLQKEVSQSHDKQKSRVIEAASAKRYLHELGLTDLQGKVYAKSQDKYKQINHYIQLLEPYLRNLSQTVSVADMGSGKGYLTFAMYDYLTTVLHKNAVVTGVERRSDMVTLCNHIASHVGFDSLRFVEGDIQNYDMPSANVLVALHACDTATDDAIAKGIVGNAELIVVAPCCHKQIRREMSARTLQNEVRPLVKHGIFMERQAEMVTDALRSLILEYHGYSTSVMEFISDVHTPKNVMIVAEKKKERADRDVKILEQISTTKNYFGIEKHYLEKVLGM